MNKLAHILILCLLSGTAFGKDLNTLIDTCKSGGTEHVFLFTDPALSDGVDISHHSTDNTVGWVGPHILKTCSAKYIALAHCHFDDNHTSHLPSSLTKDGGSDIVSIVVYEKMCAPVRLVPGAELPPIEHMVVVVSSGKVSTYSLGPRFRNLIRTQSSAPSFGDSGASPGVMSGRGPNRPHRRGASAQRFPPHVQAVLTYEKLLQAHLQRVATDRSPVSLPEMVKGHEPYFTAREWNLW